MKALDPSLLDAIIESTARDIADREARGIDAGDVSTHYLRGLLAARWALAPEDSEIPDHRVVVAFAREGGGR